MNRILGRKASTLTLTFGGLCLMLIMSREVVAMMDMNQIQGMVRMVTPELLVSLFNIPPPVAEEVVKILKEPGDLMSKLPKLMAVKGLDVAGIMARIGKLADLAAPQRRR